jgi:hypothetical protein
MTPELFRAMYRAIGHMKRKGLIDSKQESELKIELIKEARK